jgi:acyl-CoA synthetase (AMP-forming)/AMP-acid ligase II/thioesterase domain-containing protein/acyl carrier protein
VHAEGTPDAVALLAPDRSPLSYASLLRQVEQAAQALNRFGIGRNDRVAVVLPNGPEMAAAFLGVSAVATCAPLNPAYRAGEFEFYLTDLRAKALIALAGADSPARAVAAALGIPVLELTPASGGDAGVFTLQGVSGAELPAAGLAEPGDQALVLHTSGTTSRPKLVPLTHANLCASARSIQATLQLSARDRCLNVMPLFHIHGLVAALLASLGAGASVVCTPGFDALRFFAWVDAFRPSWYTAVPTMHQAVLGQADANRAIIARRPLRFLRSSSSALPPQLLEALELAFGAPVIEAYGMTEAAHQMASNPLPPRRRKPGSVGQAAGPEVAIMDEAGQLLPANQTGEVVIRGASVTAGYENNPAANVSSFTSGWFRTGDQGYLDAEGYLYLTGRIKELINRGGEKVSPREVDEVLLGHPAVAQAVTFAVPHPTLGEEVAAAVVPRAGAVVTAQELRQFVVGRLAYFKVPRQIVIRDELPKGPTGKLQRIGLAQALGVTAAPGQGGRKEKVAAPRTATEKRLAAIWGLLLGVDPVGIRDDFFQLGGDSILAAGLFAEIEKVFGRILPPAVLFEGATIEQLARVLEQPEQPPQSLIVPIQPAGSSRPFFCVHGNGGEVFCFMRLARHLGTDRPFYGIRAKGMEQPDHPLIPIEALAAEYIQQLRRVQPTGPYLLGGYSFGGTVAFEMAQQLHRQGEKVNLLAILDHARPPRSATLRANRPHVGRFLRNVYYWLVDDIFYCRPGEILARFGRKARAVCGLSRSVRPAEYAVAATALVPNKYRQLSEALYQAQAQYVPRPYPGRVVLLRARRQPLFYPPPPDMGWGRLARAVEVCEVPGTHGTILDEPHVAGLARRLRAVLESADGERP